MRVSVRRGGGVRGGVRRSGGDEGRQKCEGE